MISLLPIAAQKMKRASVSKYMQFTSSEITERTNIKLGIVDHLPEMSVINRGLVTSLLRDYNF